MYAFFVSLLVIEALREVMVIGDADEALPLVREELFTVGHYTVAQGRWVRTDKDELLVPQATRIDCYRDRGECFETGYNVFNGNSITTPGNSIHAAQFDASSIVFTDASASCVETTTRIDLTSRETYRVRSLKELPSIGSEELCDDLELEQRMELQLAGYDHPSLKPDPLKGHFVPLASAITWAFS